MKSKKPARPAAARRAPKPTLDAPMTSTEKESLEQQIEEFEGPDRREKRGSTPPEPHEPGVARS